MGGDGLPTSRLAAAALRVLQGAVCAGALAWSATAGADETLASTSPLAAASTNTTAELRATKPAPPASNTHKTARTPRHFPALGPVTVGGATYYPYRFEGHVHTEHSRDARHPTVEILTAAEQLGLDAIVITDHGESRARFDFSNYQGRLVPLIGREIGGAFGHAVMWNVSDDSDLGGSKTTLETRSGFAHARGGLLVFAHPGWWIDGNDQDPMRWMTPEALRRDGIAGSIDAIELWNGVYRTPLTRLVNAWVGLLEAGVYVPIVGNSDFHSFGSHQLGNAHNIALCDTPDVSTCLWPAVREGRLIVTDGPGAVLSVNGQLPGSVVAGDLPLHVAVDALAPEGGVLRVYLGRQVVQTLQLAAGVRTQAEWQLASPASDSFVRVDIARPNPVKSQTPVSLLSNPVLIDVGVKRASWR